MLSIVAIDPSLTCTAVAGWKQGEPWVRTIKPGTLRGVPRLEFIREAVLEECVDARLVLIEGYAYGAKGRAVVSMGELGGVLRLGLWLEGIPYVEVAPTSLKKFATGNGNASKEEVLAEAIRRLKYEGHSNDVADALWLLHMGLQHYGIHDLGLPKKNLSALDKVEFPTPSDLMEVT